jgi:HEAT repeat protein
MSLERSVDDLVQQLRDANSTKRRAAARKLRNAGDPSAAPALVSALSKELMDRRTWETQYQMIMALAVSQPTVEAMSLLEGLFSRDLEPMVHLAAGDALVRASKSLDGPVTRALRSGSQARAEGAIRALAMIHGIPGQSTIEFVVKYAQESAHRQVRFCVASASAGWPDAAVRAFLEECLFDESADTRRAAQASLVRRYLKWNPL